jgi:phosphoenolpyruvate carboxylase
MITKNFGAPAIAERTLDIYTAAVLREAFTEHVRPTKKWRKQMERIAEVSCADYRYLVREEPRFVPYFRQATPELELGSLNIGSRPAKRNPKGGIEVSEPYLGHLLGLKQELTCQHGWEWVLVSSPKIAMILETLRAMYTEWPWFRETIDLYRH